MPAKDSSVPLGTKQAAIHPVTSQSQGEVEDIVAKNTDDNTLDEAAKYLANANTGQHAPLTPEREKKLLRKIDSWIIPLVSNCCCELTNWLLMMTRTIASVYVHARSRR